MDISTVPPAYSRPVAVGNEDVGADLALVHEDEHARTFQGIETDRHGSHKHRQPGDIFLNRSGRSPTSRIRAISIPRSRISTKANN